MRFWAPSLQQEGTWLQHGPLPITPYWPRVGLKLSTVIVTLNPWDPCWSHRQVLGGTVWWTIAAQSKAYGLIGWKTFLRTPECWLLNLSSSKFLNPWIIPWKCNPDVSDSCIFKPIPLLFSKGIWWKFKVNFLSLPNQGLLQMIHTKVNTGWSEVWLLLSMFAYFFLNSIVKLPKKDRKENHYAMP